MRADAACSSDSDTGAPADRNNSTRPRAVQSASVSASAVVTTLATAAGERNTTVDVVPSLADATAAATAFAVSDFGEVTFMSGVTDRAPRAGPSRAKGANPATNPVPGPTPYWPASAWQSAESCWCV